MEGKDFHLLIKSTLAAYGDSARRAWYDLMRNWIILAGSVALAVFFMLMLQLIAHMPGSGGISPAGFIVGLLFIAAVSLYYSWLDRTIQGEKLKLRDLAAFDSGLFSSVISAAFIIFIVEFLLKLLLQPAGLGPLVLMFHFAIIVIMNPLPEVVYLHRLDGISSLKAAAEFTLNNWIEWFVPLLLLLLPLLALHPDRALMLLAGTDPFLPGFIPLKQAIQLIRTATLGETALLIILGILVGNWFMLFRAYLFRELDGSSKRKRIYQARQQR